MKIVDEKGKLFGLINLIDLLLIVVVVAGIAFAAVKFSDSSAITTGQTVSMSFYTEEVSDFVAEKIKVGDALMDADRNVALGTVTDVKIEPGISWSTNSDGEPVKASREGFVSITITGEMIGEAFENGVIIGATKYGVGHSMTLRAGDAKIYLRVSDLQIKE